jgi:uncharacterized protein (TIGR00369 family)
LGTELYVFADGQSELRLTLAERHLNSGDVAHGGVVMTLLDVAMAFAARSANADSVAVATIEMKTTFMRPSEGTLRAVGKVQHKTSSLAFCEAAMYDDKNALCASATGTFKYFFARGQRGARPASAPSNTAPKDTP